MTNRLVLFFEQAQHCSYSNMTWIHIKNGMFTETDFDPSPAKQKQVHQISNILKIKPEGLLKTLTNTQLVSNSAGGV